MYHVYKHMEGFLKPFFHFCFDIYIHFLMYFFVVLKMWNVNMSYCLRPEWGESSSDWVSEYSRKVFESAYMFYFMFMVPFLNVVEERCEEGKVMIVCRCSGWVVDRRFWSQRFSLSCYISVRVGFILSCWLMEDVSHSWGDLAMWHDQERSTLPQWDRVWCSLFIRYSWMYTNSAFLL